MKFGLTQQFDCSYLSDKKERLLVYVDEQQADVSQYELLINSGFRRSGEQIYRPHCKTCHACQSLRIPVAQFTPSQSQKRVLSKNQDIEVVLSEKDKPIYYPLYEQYINARHRDGSMFPATYEQYYSFIGCEWANPVFLECYIDKELVAVAVTDNLNASFSALYTFFRPDMAKRSVGTLAILKQIEQAKLRNKQYLYLGYQVDACQKMNYKRNFYPHERLIDNKWHYFSKKQR
jgi:arginyl-tRNA--protein-N-Asp/Glu arginylyltransferase